MKKLVLKISALAFLALVVSVMSACTSKNKAVVVDSDDADEEVVDDSDEAGEALADEDNTDLVFDAWTLHDVLLLLHEYDIPRSVQTTGMSLLYKYEELGDEVDCTEYVYAHDVEKGAKQAFGYNLKATSDHGCYFRIGIDTSINACLGFVSESDAKRFFKRLSKAEPTDYDGKTYYVNKKADDQSLYIDTRYEEDGFNTNYLIYPPVEEDGFYNLQIEFWM